MKSLNNAVIVVLVAAAVVAVLLGRETLKQRPATANQPPSSHRAPSSTTKAPEATKASELDVSAKLRLSEYKKGFVESHDLWAFAQTILPAATAGDADAEYFLSKTLDYCDKGYRYYFAPNGQDISQDEGLQRAVKLRLNYEVAQNVYQRCHSFRERDSSALGTAAGWLANATAAGQPIAQATTAEKLLTQAGFANMARAAGVANANPEGPVVAELSPRALYRAAAQSLEPDALFRIGEAQYALDPTNNADNINRFAWWLVACERGLDCSANSEAVRFICGGNIDSACASGARLVDLASAFSEGRWPDVQRRAQEISAKLDAGLWNDLGLGS